MLWRVKEVDYKVGRRCWSKIKSREKVAYAIGVKLRDKHYKDHSMQMQLTYALDTGIDIADEIIYLMLYKMYGLRADGTMSLKDYYDADNRKLTFEVRQASVFAFKLSENVELNLITEISKHKKVDLAVDKINKKYNKNLVRSGTLFEPWYAKYV